MTLFRRSGTCAHCGGWLYLEIALDSPSEELKCINCSRPAIPSTQTQTGRVREPHRGATKL